MKSQEHRVLERLQQANGEWVHGDRVFLGEMRLRQYHRAIFNLENKRDRYKYNGTIEHSSFADEFGFRSYRLITQPVQNKLI